MPVYKIKYREDGKTKVAHVRASSAQAARAQVAKSSLRRGKNPEMV